ncbi:MAG TPA: hypothetical protein VM493_01485, partial [Vicinamibacterales bacterium]|nr:hypothetical protein [Vicinamibacterales bacterium]
MTERSLYAHAAAVILTACLILAGRAEAQGPACAACIGVTTGPGQALLLPGELGGITILVREQDAPVDSLRAALNDIRRRGGRAALLVVAPPAPPDLAEQAYRLKLRLTELRGAFDAGVTIAMDVSGVPPGTVRDLAGYVDVLIGDTPDPARRSSPRTSWQLLPTTDVTAALEATRRGGSEVWVMRAPDDVLEAHNLLIELARLATAPAEGFSEDVEVRAARRLTVDEIIARHQAFARRQAARVTHTIASGTMTLTFEAPGFPAPVTIESETFIY